MTTEEYLRNQDAVYSVWAPLPDITIHELALFVATATSIRRLTIDEAERIEPASALRHFTWIFDSRNSNVKARIDRLLKKVEAAQ